MWMRITRQDGGLTPFEMVYGRPFPLPGFNVDEVKADRENTEADWMRQMLKEKEPQEHDRVPDDLLFTQETVKPGDHVLIKVLHRNSWNSPRWEGPYQGTGHVK
ncbi:uncharacterized protein V6R79_017523 [Siganus canaliculatus]